MNRRRLLGLAAAAAMAPLLGPLRPTPARAAVPPNLQFRAMHRNSPVGQHIISFRMDGDRLTVTTRIEITIKVLFVTAFSFKHDAEEVWRAGRLVSVKSATEDQGTLVQVSGYAAGDGFRIVGADGPSLAAAHLLTSNTLWDSRLVRESRVIDVQYGSEVGLVAKQLGDEQVETPHGRVRATRHQIITPHYAGTLFYDADGRWIKGLIEQQGEVVEYVLAT